MKKRLRFTFFFLVACYSTLASWGQAPVTASASVIPWFTVQHNSLVVQTGNKSKLLTQDVTLPNGVRLEHRTKSIVFANGTRVQMREGDLLSLSGDYMKKPSTDEPATADSSLIAAPRAPATTLPGPAASPAAFAYHPVAPVGGTLKGVVELGASGFNSFIVRIDDKHNWQLEKAEYGNSLVLENMATADDVRNGLKAYIGKMLDFGVSGRNIHFVVSSGAAMAEGTRRIVQELEGLKYMVTVVTPEREGALGLRAAMPLPYADRSFVLDLGSANSKIAWLEQGQPKVLDTYGSKYYEKGLADATVATEVKAKAEQVPAKVRGTCFIIGGVPYDMAKTGRQGQEPFTVLRAPGFYAQLPGAKVHAGLNIYQAVAEATGCEQFVFTHDTNFTIGYLLSLP